MSFLKIHKNILTILLIASMAHPTFALSDGFEDGDYTSDPTWQVINPVGTVSVEPDPIRLDNLALKIRGTDQAHHVLSTTVDQPFAAFDFSAEFLPTTYMYHPAIGVVSNQYLSIELYCAPPPRKLLVREMVWYDTGPVEYFHSTDITSLSPNTWFRLHLWHDIENDQVHGEVRQVSDNSLIAGFAFTPA